MLLIKEKNNRPTEYFLTKLLYNVVHEQVCFLRSIPCWDWRARVWFITNLLQRHEYIIYCQSARTVMVGCRFNQRWKNPHNNHIYKQAYTYKLNCLSHTHNKPLFKTADVLFYTCSKSTSHRTYLAWLWSGSLAHRFHKVGGISNLGNI